MNPRTRQALHLRLCALGFSPRRRKQLVEILESDPTWVLVQDGRDGRNYLLIGEEYPWQKALWDLGVGKKYSESC